MADNYVYAVARIRSLETALFTESVIGQLLACKTYESALDFLAKRDGATAIPEGMRAGC